MFALLNPRRSVIQESQGYQSLFPRRTTRNRDAKNVDSDAKVGFLKTPQEVWCDPARGSVQQKRKPRQTRGKNKDEHEKYIWLKPCVELSWIERKLIQLKSGPFLLHQSRPLKTKKLVLEGSRSPSIFKLYSSLSLCSQKYKLIYISFTRESKRCGFLTDYPWIWIGIWQNLKFQICWWEPR